MCTAHFLWLHAKLTFFSFVHTPSGAPRGCLGGGRGPSPSRTDGAARGAWSRTPAHRPVAAASDVYCPDSSGQTPVKRVHFPPLCTKTQIPFFPPLHRLFNSDNGSLLPGRLLRRPATPQTPPSDLPQPLHAPSHDPCRCRRVPRAGTYRENTK